ncbi:MAG: N-acetyltransferase [Bifidobacterium sp.]|jgi:hypothetical protein|nr:N-acetyltransferase [Bifidobacterium sp.]
MGNSVSSRHFRQAIACDYEQIQRIYAHARALMAKNGNPTQWGDSFPLADTVRRDIAAGRTMLLVDNEASNEAGAEGSTGDGIAQERILAQFVLCPGDDPTYREIDGNWLDDDPYVTIHRIASSGLVARVAYDCLKWAVEQYGNVRIDTHPNNMAMQHVIERSGFVRCGLISLLDRETDKTRIAYQRHNR